MSGRQPAAGFELVEMVLADGASRDSHLRYQRRYFGWGVFVLRPAG